MKTAILALAVLLAGCDYDPRKEVRTTNLGAASSYDPVLYIDRDTGCHYLSTGNINSLTPRMGADGKQICKARVHSDNEVREKK